MASGKYSHADAVGIHPSNTDNTYFDITTQNMNQQDEYLQKANDSKIELSSKLVRQDEKWHNEGDRVKGKRNRKNI